MKIGIVGCGFVADLYLDTLARHPELELVGVTDTDQDRAAKLAKRAGVRHHDSLTGLLDGATELVLNLTNPRSHYEVSVAAIEAGKHVYSEKPLAMAMDKALDLAERADRAGVALSSAPCSILGETAQTMWRAIRRDRVGRVRAVYAEMDDGMVHLMQYRKWLSPAGTPWPFKDEFEIGCTLEHAGYCLTWLAAWFGPAESVQSFASVQIPDKCPGVELDLVSPDFSVACIQFANGVVARLTTSLVGPHDHSVRVIGERGVLSTHDSWDFRSRVSFHRFVTLRRRSFVSKVPEPVRLAPSPYVRTSSQGAQTIDFGRGPAEMVAALRERRRSRLPTDFCLHVNEMVLAIHSASTSRAAHRMTTTFEPLSPTDWAQ